MCKHNWLPILPSSDKIEESLRMNFAIEKMLGRFNDIVYCDKCFHTGHYIKSYRGGIRRHYESSYIERANIVRGKFNFQLINQVKCN